MTLRNLDSGDNEVVSFDYVIDATELGDLLALSGDGVRIGSGIPRRDRRAARCFGSSSTRQRAVPDLVFSTGLRSERFTRNRQAGAVRTLEELRA